MPKSKSKRQPEKLGFRNAVRLGYVSLFTDVSTEIILGVLPLFIVQDLGGTAAILELIEGLAESSTVAFQHNVVTSTVGIIALMIFLIWRKN